MTREEALERVEEYLTSYLPIDDHEEVEEILKALRQKFCDDAVSRQTVLSVFPRWKFIGYEAYIRSVAEIENLPTVTPQPKMGKWIFADKAKEHACCSKCGYGNVDLFDGRLHNYCENCGAKMEVGI